MGGANDSLGLVEVCINNGWGGVCVDHFGTFDAEVVCNQLGFSHQGIYALSMLEHNKLCWYIFAGYSIAIFIDATLMFGLPSGPMFLDKLSCAGKELAILDCRASPVGLARCNVAAAAGVHCTGIMSSNRFMALNPKCYSYFVLGPCVVGVESCTKGKCVCKSGYDGSNCCSCQEGYSKDVNGTCQGVLYYYFLFWICCHDQWL